MPTWLRKALYLTPRDLELQTKSVEELKEEMNRTTVDTPRLPRAFATAMCQILTEESSEKDRHK
jgi:hypothetical protein